ncbi:hypothetical protein ACQP2P_32385 [Dactylosporangium sp. CA-139114]|uniref:hypothetical protein n=1 Tax=Dactylosporangium sp. CA-139114 TaxID=3239931 RepID=UPI003D959DA4
MTAPALDVETVRSAGDIPEQRWDALAGGLYGSHRWHRFQERERAGIDARHLIASRAGEAVAALPLYRLRDETHGAYRLGELLPESVARDEHHVLLGNRHGYNNGLLVRPGTPEPQRREVFGRLLERAGAWFDERQVPTAWWPYLDDEGVATLRPLLAGRVPLLLGCEAALALPGDGFADYLGMLSRRRARAVSAERDAFARQRYHIVECRLGECVEDVVALGLQTTAKYGGSGLSTAAARRMIAQQAEVLDPVTTVLFCAGDDGPAGFAMLLEHGDAAYARTVGFDYARLRSAYEYFEMLFYQPIERAYRLGRRRIWFGTTSYRAKVSRGCLLYARWALPVRVAAWPDSAVRRHNRELVARLEEELGTLRRALPYDTILPHC